MANMSKCSSCKRSNPLKLNCEVYKSGIPKDVLIELVDCEYYNEKKIDKYSPDLPMAKGR